MKANDAPRKIYIPTAGDKIYYHMTCPKNEFKESIEYTRTDAFIAKVINFLNYELDDIVAIQNPDSIIPQHIVKPELIEDFKKYIEEYNV